MKTNHHLLNATSTLNPHNMLPPVFNAYGAAPLVSTTFGCLAATYDRVLVSPAEDPHDDDFFTRIDEILAEIVRPSLSLFWLELAPDASVEPDREIGLRVQTREEYNRVGASIDAQNECKLLNVSLLSARLISLEDDFIGKWWVEVLTGDNRKDMHGALIDAVEDKSNSTAQRAAAAAVFSKLASPSNMLPTEIIRYMLDCRVAMNSLRIRMQYAESPRVAYLAKRRKADLDKDVDGSAKLAGGLQVEASCGLQKPHPPTKS